MIAAMAIACSSFQGLATTCTPIGSPPGDVPPRTATAGHPVTLNTMVSQH